MMELLDASDCFDNDLVSLLENGSSYRPHETPRCQICYASALLSIEHARMVRVAFARGSPNSGSALLRLQFESLLKAAWVLHIANDTQVSRLTDVLTQTTEQAAKNLPGVADILAALVSKGPPGLAHPLQEFYSTNSRALNSFVHGGIHPVSRTNNGYSHELASQVVRLSNGLLHMSYRILASLSGSQELMARITHAYKNHQVCLPIKESRHH
jgi:hypothetical protein